MLFFRQIRPLFRILFLVGSFVVGTSCKKDLITIDPELPIPGIDRVFNDENLPSLFVYVEPSEWNNLLSKYDSNHQTRDYVKCDVKMDFGGGKFYEVHEAGLRLRGQTSRNRPEGGSGPHVAGRTDWQHCHFGLHFRKFVKDSEQQIEGVRRINLKYAHEDPSFIREHYCFDLLQRYGVWTAPKTSWCRLYLYVRGDPGFAYYGVYLMMESIDNRYVKNRPEFGSEEGFLWKCGWNANLRDTDDWRFHLDDNGPDTYAYELKDEDETSFAAAKAQIRDFITKFNQYSGAAFQEWIERVCDVKLLLRMYAVNIAVGQWDDYWNDMNNFYVFFNSRDSVRYKFYMLPYDYDNTLGTSHRCGVQTDSGRHDPYHWGMEQCPLISKILSFPEYRDYYTQCLEELASEDNSYFNYRSSLPRISRWQNLISPYLPNDTGEDESLRDAPASWGNHPEYRILLNNESNWFKIKCESIRRWTSQ